VNLWMDSVDFPRIGKRSVSRRSSNWSYKCNGPAQRYMVLQDGKSRIVKVWGSYNPKVYDGLFLEVVADWIDDTLFGVSVIADNHFKGGNESCENVVFHTNIEEPHESKNKDTMEGFRKLTKKQLSWNEAHRKARARVESPFGRVKSMFKSLGTLYRKRKEAQKHMVKIGFAIHNINIKD
jgi:hypothetical protein